LRSRLRVSTVTTCHSAPPFHARLIGPSGLCQRGMSPEEVTQVKTLGSRDIIYPLGAPGVLGRFLVGPMGSGVSGPR
jgi:hypothetical protein